MDSITHIALGACIGEVFFGKTLKKKVMVWGALAQSVPDVDFIAATWLDPSANLLAHRGFTHSILFAILISISLALAAEKWHRPHNIGLRRWFVFFITEVLIHLFIDGMNSYGVGWFEPFSHTRISTNMIFVVDPFFSIWPGLAIVICLIVSARPRRYWAWIGIIPAFIYLAYCGVNKLNIQRQVIAICQAHHLPANKILTTPTPMNSWLWYIVIGTDSGYYTGYCSVFDKGQDQPLAYFPKNDYLLDNMKERAEVQHLLQFSQGYYTVGKRGDTTTFNILRFGQIAGWYNPKAEFAFHYYLTGAHDNLLVLQRGRFEGWNKATIQSMLNRIKGKPQ